MLPQEPHFPVAHPSARIHFPLLFCRVQGFAPPNTASCKLQKKKCLSQSTGSGALEETGAYGWSCNCYLLGVINAIKEANYSFPLKLHCSLILIFSDLSTERRAPKPGVRDGALCCHSDFTFTFIKIKAVVNVVVNLLKKRCRKQNIISVTGRCQINENVLLHFMPKFETI